ncbi:hypothetical protein, partial [Streptococcus cristatus]
MRSKRRLKKKPRNLKKTCFEILSLSIFSALVLFFVLTLCFGLPKLYAIGISSVMALMMAFMMTLLFGVKYLYKEFLQEPFTILTGLLVAIFILLPLLFSFFKVEDIPDVMKAFLSIVIPIGVNSAFDGLFKIIETHFDSEEKEQVVRYGGSFKFIFNSLYLATTLAIFTIQNILLPLYEKKDTISICFLKFTKREIWGTLPVFTIS